jgi:hypothetical protein
MADPLGVTSSILTILHLAAGLSLYIHSVATAPAAAHALGNELAALQNVLKALQKFVRDDDDDDDDEGDAGVLQGIAGCLKGVLEELERVRGKLEMVTCNPRMRSELPWEESMRRGAERLKWPLRERETAALVTRIERVRGICVVAMAMDQLYSPFSSSPSPPPPPSSSPPPPPPPFFPRRRVLRRWWG